jgi:predicted AAA+ superfamily ATPase
MAKSDDNSSRPYVPRLLTLPRGTFFLLGPRGTGKTTWLRKNLPGAAVIDLLAEENYQRLLANPDLFAAQVRALPKKSWVVVDEIQRLPNLLNEVHRLIEESGRRFVLSGSSARKLRRGGVNLLGGRAVQRFMHPFIAEELGKSFSLEDSLRFGLLPVIRNSPDREDALRAYGRLYLKEEIHAEALVRNLPGFARFLPIAALFHGRTINVANIARECGVARTTVTGYVEILEETLMCYRVTAFEAKLRVKERKLPKLYWFDPGVVRALTQTSGEPHPEERGALFEGLVAQLIRTNMDYRGICDELHYWAPSESAMTEVDFLLKRGRDSIAVEVKSGKNFDESWCRGLRAIHGLKGLRRRILVYPHGPALKTRDGIEVLSFDSFSTLLAGKGLWTPPRG